MGRNNRQTFIDIVILVVLSLLPFWWLGGGEIILGHDAGTPLSPQTHFEDRLSVWTSRYNAGTDQTFAVAGFFIHGFEAALEMTGLSLSHQQAIQFSTYFFLFGLSMYLFARTLFSSEKKYLPLIAAVLYQYNHFILQAWFIAERTKFTTYIALPLILLILYKILSSRQSPFILALISSLVLFVFNGGGFFPLYGALFVSSSIFVVSIFIQVPDKKESLIRIIQFGLYGVAFSILLNAYWLLPYIQYVRSSYVENIASAGGLSGTINWIISISENTSYMNLLRLQGIQEWYVNAEHPYAAKYFTPLFTALSFLLPLVFVFSLKSISKKNKIVVVSLILVGLASIFFMAGSHPPFGWLYIQMVKYIPGFIAFRTPFYKFSPGLYIAFAPLLALLVSRVLSKFSLSTFKKYAAQLIVIAAILAYNFPFFTVDFFQYTPELSTKVAVPQYVYDYGIYANSSEFEYQKTLLFPGKILGTNYIHYEWGYWSLASLHSLLDKRLYIEPPGDSKFIDQKLYLELYESLLEKNDDWLLMAQNLGIDSVLLQTDFIDFVYKDIQYSADDYKEFLAESNGLILKKSFGEWQLFEVAEVNNFTNEYAVVSTADDSAHIYDYLFSGAGLNPSTQLLSTDADISRLNRVGRYHFLSCQDCLLEREQIYLVNPNIIATPGSLFYKLLPFTRDPDVAITSISEDPRLSLRQLYTLRTQFFTKEESKYRAITWRKYLESLERYQKNLLVVLSSDSDPISKNSLAFGLFNNLLLQEEELLNLSTYINTKEESERFFEARTALQTMIRSLLESVEISNTKHQGNYNFSLSEPGEYDLVVHSDTLNSSLGEGGVISFSVNGENTTRDIDELPVTNGWLNLGSWDLSEGFNQIIISDSNLNRDLLTDEIRYDTELGCSIVPLKNLSEDMYELSVGISSTADVSGVDFSELKKNVQAQEDLIGIYYFVEPVGSTTPLLPYWGVSQEIRLGSDAQSLVLFRAFKNVDYNLYICDIQNLGVSPIEINSITLDRLAKPVVVVASEDQTGYQSVVSQIETMEISNTEWFVPTVEEVGLVSLPFKYSPLWAASPDSEVFRSASGNQVVLNSPENQDVRLRYVPQQKLIIGAMVSSAGLASLLAISVVHVVIKRRGK